MVRQVSKLHSNDSSRPRIRRILVVALLALGLERVPAASVKPAGALRELQVAAAADLNFAMQSILDKFHRLHPDILIHVTYGSSGNFFSQLSNRAPFDLFLSADTSYPRKLLEQGAALDGSTFSYAIGRLVLWVPSSSTLALERLGGGVLKSGEVRHIALANPRHAPYGMAAVAYLRAAGLYDVVRTRLVYGENVAQAFQFIQSGAAETGFIACALALAPEVRNRGRYWEVPRDKYPRIEQAGLILKWTKEPAAARELRTFFLGEQARRILIDFGFYIPGE